MLDCAHQSAMEIEKLWLVDESRQFWDQIGETLKSVRFWLPVCPWIKFYFTATTCGSNFSIFRVTFDEPMDPKDFDCFFWCEKDGEVVAGHKGHDYEPIEFHCRIVFKSGCPFCGLRIRDAQIAELNETMEQLKLQISDLKEGLETKKHVERRRVKLETHFSE
ncbi:hypothetical protein M3Y98_00098300 [Aphelenchoides besseyi]|nr:hypothetical protein M3Y98_00098300 [Aphelenchoides besseyi]KAI6198584.1 hypothetical protein M3Y96_00534700 [Aphelenchoides besseyi]